MPLFNHVMDAVDHERNRMLHAAKIFNMIEKDRDGLFCDLTLVSGERRFSVHKIIVCSQSRVISTACTGQYKEASGVFDVKEWPSELVERMIEYMYTGSYAEWPLETNENGDGSASDEPCLAHPLVFHATMASLADMYMVDGLQTLAKTRFVCAARQMTDLRRFLDAAPAIYALEADSCKGLRTTFILWLRHAAVRTTEADHVMTLIEAALVETPAFAVDLAVDLYRDPVLGRCSACGVDEVVPVEPLQCRCRRCDRGGAVALQKRFAWEQRQGLL